MPRISLVLIGILWASTAGAQWAVEEVGPQLHNSYITMEQAIDTAINTANTVSKLQQSVDWLTRLGSNLGSFVMSEEFVTELNRLAGLVIQADATMTNVSSLHQRWGQLFDLNTAPYTSAELALRRQQMNSYRSQASWYAGETQTLITNTIQSVTRIILLGSQLGALIGVTQTTNITNQLLQQLNQLQAQELVMMSAVNRLITIDQASKALTEESRARIMQHILTPSK